MNQLGETSKGSVGGAISLADYCSMKPTDTPGSRLQ